MYKTWWRECTGVIGFYLLLFFYLQIGQDMQNYSSHSNHNLTTMCIY